jgi:hypothetical protein
MGVIAVADAGGAAASAPLLEPKLSLMFKAFDFNEVRRPSSFVVHRFAEHRGGGAGARRDARRDETRARGRRRWRLSEATRRAPRERVGDASASRAGARRGQREDATRACARRDGQTRAASRLPEIPSARDRRCR